MTLIQIIIIALLVESVVETLQLIWKPEKINREIIFAILVGIILAFVVEADIIQILGFEKSIPYVGIILTGILLSRGSNWIHDIIKKIEALK